MSRLLYPGKDPPLPTAWNVGCHSHSERVEETILSGIEARSLGRKYHSPVTIQTENPDSSGLGSSRSIRRKKLPSAIVLQILAIRVDNINFSVLRVAFRYVPLVVTQLKLA
jgi:hypothetical protein